MKHGPVALALVIVLAGPGHAAPQPNNRLSTGETRTYPRPRLNLRLVQDSIFDPDPVYHSGIVAQTEIAPGATVGFGLLKAKPKKPGSGDWRLDNGAPRSRKAAVNILLRF